MNRLLLIIITFFIYQNVKGQSAEAIVFEQKALDFFTDSIINSKLAPFDKYKIYFDGETDSSITYIQRDFALRYPSDTALYASSQRPLHNRKQPVYLIVRYPLISRRVRHFGYKSKKMILLMHQSRKVGDKNYVLLKGFINGGSQAYVLYFVLDNNGTIVNWSNEGTIIF
ncbi:MAG: hypothetical protein MH472_02825 [Bacteroidia bacterium]|nr:hypothetical protein [Bacteroidia bacterium]